MFKKLWDRFIFINRMDCNKKLTLIDTGMTASLSKKDH